MFSVNFIDGNSVTIPATYKDTLDGFNLFKRKLGETTGIPYYNIALFHTNSELELQDFNDDTTTLFALIHNYSFNIKQKITEIGVKICDNLSYSLLDTLYDIIHAYN